MSEEKWSNDNVGWSNDNVELCVLLSKIEFDLSVDDNKNITRRLKNEKMWRCHPDL
jgi:hypothetical protein